MYQVVAGFLPLDKGKVNEVHEGLAVPGEEGIFFSRASRKIVHWTIFSPKGEHAT